MASQTFKEGDYVEAVGLANAKILNGKRGWVKRIPNTSGRLAVKFEGQDTLKLIKPCNLKEPVIPPDKDDPRMGYKGLDGRINPILIEHAQGKTCSTCGCNLEGVYRVEAEGVSYCESDYVRDFCPSSLYNVCILCHKFVPLRELEAFPGARDMFSDFHPSGKLPNGESVKYFDNGGCFVHKSCFECTLCGRHLWDRDAAPNGFTVRPSKEPSATVLLEKSPPGSQTWCDTQYDSFIEASNRKSELESLAEPELCSILGMREVPFTQDEEKSSLVRKVIVTDKKKGEKTGHVVTQFGEHGNVTSERLVQSRAAAGVALRNLRCNHGSQTRFSDNEEQALKREHVNQYCIGPFRLFMQKDSIEIGPGMRVPTFRAACMALIDFWATRQRILKSDAEERFISKSCWSAAVSTCTAEEGGYEYSLGMVATSLITGTMTRLLEDKDELNDEDLVSLLERQPLASDLEDISRGLGDLYEFMHRPDRRYCECMEYVATVAEIGRVRNKNFRIKENLEHCAFCGATLVKPKVCTRCEHTAYCSKMCQKEHWKTHKKECAGRKKSTISMPGLLVKYMPSCLREL